MRFSSRSLWTSTLGSCVAWWPRCAEPGSHRIHLATKPADFRKSVDGLSGEVRRVLGGDPTSGHVFVFHNRRRTALKLLWWDRSGFCLLYKRLEKGQTWRARPDVGATMPDFAGNVWPRSKDRREDLVAEPTG